MLKSRFKPRNFSRPCVSGGAAVAPTAADTGAQAGHRPAVLAVVRPAQLLRPRLRLRVAVHVRLRQRMRLVGAVMVPRRVDTETAQLDEPLQRPTAADVEQVLQG